MKTILFLLTITTVVFSNQTDSVKVWDSTFAVINIISDSSELLEFSKVWDEKSEVIVKVRPTWTHKVDVIPGNRWLYHTDGYATILRKTIAPIYKIENHNRLNMLLGIELDANVDSIPVDEKQDK